LVPQRETPSLVTAVSSSGTSSIGWLKLEERDADQYRGLLSWVEHEEGSLPFTMVMRRQRWWSTRHPTAAWAGRYGGGYDRVKQLISRSVVKHHLIAVVAVLVLVLVGYFGYLDYARRKQAALDQLARAQQIAIANRNFQLTVASAQKLLDQVDKSLNH